MEYRYRNVTALGLLVLVAGALFVWGFSFMMGRPILTPATEVVMTLDNGGGLNRGDPVQLNGVQVGTVQDVRLLPGGSVTVGLRLNDNVRLPADTRAVVRSDMFGKHLVSLVPGQALVKLEKGDTIRGNTAQALTEMASDLGGQARTLLTRADSLLSPATVRDMRETASVMPDIAVQLRQTLTEFRLAAASLRKTSQEVESAKTGAALASALHEVEGSARSFNEAAVTLNRSLGSLASVLEKVDRGEGTLGLLVNDTTLYGRLNSTLEEMRALAADVRQNPKKYVSIRIF